MRVLIYKRTHKHDPDENGVFGIEDCMGRIRNWNYDAVIGIGAKSVWKGHEGIKYRINWIGLEPKRISSNGRGDIVVFTHFKLYEEEGVNIEEYYPNLFNYMYVDGNRKRFDMSSDMPKNVFTEVIDILNSIKDSPQSNSYNIENIDELGVRTNNHASSCTICLKGHDAEIIIQEVDHNCIKQ